MAKTVPNIVTTPPGPEATKWLERNRETMAPYNRPFYYPLVVAGGEGAVVRDVDGNEYIDWNSGLGVLNVGQSTHSRKTSVWLSMLASGVEKGTGYFLLKV